MSTASPEITAALSKACAAAGFDPAAAVPVRLGENAIFRLPGGVIARISRPGQHFAARREVAVSQWLNGAGIAAVTAIAGIAQPVEAGERSITFWEELPPHRHGTPAEVAGVLRRLHAQAIPDKPQLGTLDPFIRLDERISAAQTLSRDDRRWLQSHAAELKPRWSAVLPGLAFCVVHGDAWAGNVVAAADGTMILLDLERCSAGPPEWDLASTAVKHLTCGLISRAEYGQFCTTYGADVTAWEGYEVVRDIRELRMTSYIAQQAAANSTYAHEAQLRVDCLRGRSGPRPWPWTPAA
jgi:hypothetical protein